MTSPDLDLSGTFLETFAQITEGENRYLEIKVTGHIKNKRRRR